MVRRPQWADRDIAVLSALQFQQKLDQGLVTNRDFPLAPVRPVRPRIDPANEQMLASGPYQMFEWDNGSEFVPMQNPVQMSTIAMNKMGRNFAIGAAAATMLGNAIGKRRAARTGWSPVWSGTLTVSTHGFYIETIDQGTIPFYFGNFESLDWENQNTIVGFYRDSSIQARVRLDSDWAELVNVLWMHEYFPNHPNRFTWFTQDWVNRATAVLGHSPFEMRPQIGQ